MIAIYTILCEEACNIYIQGTRKETNGEQKTHVNDIRLAWFVGNAALKLSIIIGEEKNYISLKALPFPEWYETVNRSECHRRLKQRPFCSSRGGMNHAESKGEGRADKKRVRPADLVWGGGRTVSEIINNWIN